MLIPHCWKSHVEDQVVHINLKSTSDWSDTAVKPVLSSHTKIDKTKVLKTNGRLMKVKRIAECSLGAFCNSFDLH